MVSARISRFAYARRQGWPFPCRNHTGAGQ